MEDLIDLWDVETFGEGLVSKLQSQARMLRNYSAVERARSPEVHASSYKETFRDDSHDREYYDFLNDLSEGIKHRTIRAWHYTRLTESEVDEILTNGVQLSTSESMCRRLDAQIAIGQISAEIADALFEKSPLRDFQGATSRSDRFWMTSHPLRVDDCCVAPLVKNWGGEVIHFWLNESKNLKQVVRVIGKGRVIEIGVPIAATRHRHVAAKSVAATFAQSRGYFADFGAFDLYAVRALGPEAILAVHTEGDATFEHIARGYPDRFRPVEK